MAALSNRAKIAPIFTWLAFMVGRRAEVQVARSARQDVVKNQRVCGRRIDCF
jgi:hypothetical protein